MPITCTAKVYFEGVYPAFNCNPYIGGTSGSPWLAPTPEGVMVVGLIAGLHQGGCYTYTSYSPRSAATPAPSTTAPWPAPSPKSARTPARTTAAPASRSTRQAAPPFGAACHIFRPSLRPPYMEQKEKAQRFARLHEDGMLVLPNAWDTAVP